VNLHLASINPVNGIAVIATLVTTLPSAAGLVPDRSVRRDFRPGLSPAFRGSAVTKPMATAFVSFQRGTPSRLCCVYGSAWPRGQVTSRCSKGTRSQGGGPYVCRKVVRLWNLAHTATCSFFITKNSHKTCYMSMLRLVFLAQSIIMKEPPLLLLLTVRTVQRAARHPLPFWHSRS